MATRAKAERWTEVAARVMAIASLAAGTAQAAEPMRPVEAEVSSAREWPYRIAAGDTLIGLASTYLLNPQDWQGLQRHNQIAEPRRLVPGSTLRIPFDWLKREAAVAEVLFVQGSVSLERSGSAAPSVQPGLRIQAADTLRTGAQSSVSLRFADGSRLLVVPDSQVTLEQLLVYGRTGITDTRVRVDRGSADSQVVPNAARAPAFEVRTPAVNLGVRGTDFRVRVDAAGGAARVEVLEGSVGTGREPAGNTPTAASPAVLVGAGFGTVAEQDRPVDPPRPLLPAPGLAAGPLTLDQLPLVLGWSPVAGATGYRAQVFSDGQPQGLLRDVVVNDTSASWSGDAELPDGSYVLRVRALDAVGLEGLDANARFVLAARPLPPAIDLPRAGAVRAGETVNLRWAMAPDVMRYRLQVADSSDFSQPLRDQPVVGNDTALTLPPGVYYWRVAGMALADGLAPGARLRNGPFGPVNAFDLRAVPELPRFEATQFSPAYLLLRWISTAAGQGVQIQLASDAAFEQRLVDQRTWGSQLQVARPAAGTYHLRLRSVIGDEAVGEFGPAEELSVPSVPWWERLWLGAESASR